MDDLHGKIALVTGSSRGIGRSIALALAESGADVAVNYRSAAGAALATQDEITGKGRRSIAVQADVSIAGDVHILLIQCLEELGPVDILVNNAGIARVQRSGEITEDDWDS